MRVFKHLREDNPARKELCLEFQRFGTPDTIDRGYQCFEKIGHNGDHIWRLVD